MSEQFETCDRCGMTLAMLLQTNNIGEPIVERATGKTVWIRELHTEINCLRRQVGQRQMKIDSLEWRLDQWSTTGKGLRRMNDKLKAELVEARAKIKLIEAAGEDYLHDALDYAQEDIRSMLKELDDLRSEKKRLKRIVTEMLRVIDYQNDGSLWLGPKIDTTALERKGYVTIHAQRIFDHLRPAQAEKVGRKLIELAEMARAEK